MLQQNVLEDVGGINSYLSYLSALVAGGGGYERHGCEIRWGKEELVMDSKLKLKQNKAQKSAIRLASAVKSIFHLYFS